MNTTAKKILNISSKVIAWLLVSFTVFMMVFTIITVTTVDKNERSIFGVRFYIVQTDSMSLSENNKDMEVHFNAGDIILIAGKGHEMYQEIEGVKHHFNEAEIICDYLDTKRK